MSKRAARIAGLGVALVAVAGALLWVVLSDADSRGPLIQGKPVAYWTRQFRAAVIDPVLISTLANEKGVAIPALVRQLSLPDSPGKDFAKRLWLRLPAALRARVPEPITPAELRAGAAVALDRIYGFVHPNTVPSLSEAQSMLPALTKALKDRDVTVRHWATGALGRLGAISAQAIEVCELALKDTDPSVRSAAVYSLGCLSRGDERAIPGLKSALTDSHPQIRKNAVETLELLGIATPRDNASSATKVK